MAETLTDNLKLSKRDTGDLNWGTGSNSNLDLLDKHAQLKLLRPPRTLLATLGAGAVGANLVASTNYFYKVTAINAAGETTENQIPLVVETQVTEPASPVPVILQWETVTGATGYRVYKSTSTGTEKFLVELTGQATSTYTDSGNTAVNAGISVPITNTARLSVSKIIAGSGITVTPTDGTGDVTIQAAGGGVASLKKTGDPGVALTGNVTLEQGTGLLLTQDNPNNKIILANAGVTGLRQQGQGSALVGDVKLDAGTGITLTQDAPNNKIVIAAAAGGGGGYSTVVVAVPSGSAATDTTNINTALTTAATNGGTVQLREGTYQINATLNIPTKVTLRGMGRAATILKGQAALDSGSNSLILSMAGNTGLQDLTVDMVLVTGSFDRTDLRATASNFQVIDCNFDSLKSQGFGVAHPTDLLPFISNWIFRGCNWSNWTDTAIRCGNPNSDVRIEQCRFTGNSSDDIFMPSGNGSQRWVVTNCVGDNVRMVINGIMPPKSAMSNCSWNLSGFQHAVTLGADCSLVNCIIVNPSSNAILTVVILDTSATGCVVSGNRFISGSAGRGIWAFGSNHTIAGNRITASIGMVIDGSNNCITGNRAEAGAITLSSGVSGNVVVGNKSTITDNSGQTNTIASNG